jgi:hypothetical protein
MEGAMRTRAAIFALAVAPPAAGATFDDRGVMELDASAVASESFEADLEALPITCAGDCSAEVVFAGDELALHGERWVRFRTGRNASFEVDVAVPADDASHVFRAWVRHARVSARAIFEYASDREVEVAYLFPSGQVTSDGWVELVSNAVSVTGTELERAFVRIDGSDVDLDAVEVVPEGDYQPGSECSGAFDPVCGQGWVCVAERCRQGDRYVPPLPREGDRDAIVEYLASRIRWLFGGRYTRTVNMPLALAEIDKMRAATTPYAFWSLFARGVQLLGDWHTSISSAIQIHDSPRRLGLCFIEGRADRTQSVWPGVPHRADILVSHVGPENTLGFAPGDRLVAIDGQHPVDWARSLVTTSWDYHAATDPDVDAEFAEAMRSLIPKYARTFSVIRCDAASMTCADRVETLSVRDIPEFSGDIPRCDNRPAYHLANATDSITTYHRVPFWPWRDRIVDSPPGEDIYGMTWDSLYGTEQGLTPTLREANEFFKQNARGVILDHRAGNGGTIDAPQAITQLVRQPFDLSVGPGFMVVAGYDGPATQEEGLAIFDQFKQITSQVYRVGSGTPDLDLPVALILHRDGSASDWLPHGMKGAPKVRIFAPHATAGAFSSFYQFGYWSRFDFQLASGDTITYEGKPLIGHGIEPDEVVEHTQSALMQGRDLPYEAALDWVRRNLK